MAFDFNNADPNTNFDLIPAGTLCKVSMFIRPPDAGQEGSDPLWKKSATSDAQYIDVEFTVLFGPFANRKFWQNFVLDGTTDGQKKAANISGSALRAILESARNVKPDDESEQGRAARSIESFADLNGLEFACKIGIEKNKSGEHPDKNKILSVLTSDNKQYRAVMSGQDTSTGTGAPAPPWGGQAPAATPDPAAPAWADNQTAATPKKPAASDNTPPWARQ